MRLLPRFLLILLAWAPVAFGQAGAPTAAASAAASAAFTSPVSAGGSSSSAARKAEPSLGPGDIVRVTVYQNPDLTVDGMRLSEKGEINVPLIGAVALGGLTVSASEQKIANLLRDGNFVLRPQVTLQVLQIRSNVISILGQVAKPGRYPVEVVGSKVSEMLAVAGGVLPGGSDVVTLVGTRNGRPIKLDIDMPTILQSGRSELDVTVDNGDIVYVDRAPTAYIYGEVQKPGAFRVERGMTLMQALAQGGGITPRGTQRGIKVHRRGADGSVTILDIGLNDTVVRDDVIYIKESLF